MTTGGFSAFAETCGRRLATTLERRPGNALNIEIGQAADRCTDRRPSHWQESVSSLRWIGSGGSPLVFGPCSQRGCPFLRVGAK